LPACYFIMYGPDMKPAFSTIELGSLCDVDISAYLQDPGQDYSYSDSIDCAKTHTRIMVVYKSVQNSEGDLPGVIAAVINLSVPGLTKSIKKADGEIDNGELYSFDEVFK
jgi:hypothetical protein